ncbi:DUF1971 domain-containing protein [Novosphingobium marinum]
MTTGSYFGQPYETPPQFNEDTLPEGIRNSHSTKHGVWGC